MRDLRVDLVLRIQQLHMVSVAGVKRQDRPEEWKCRCGIHHMGDGAIRKGRRHVAEETVAALDEAATS